MLGILQLPYADAQQFSAPFTVTSPHYSFSVEEYSGYMVHAIDPEFWYDSTQITRNLSQGYVADVGTLKFGGVYGWSMLQRRSFNNDGESVYDSYVGSNRDSLKSSDAEVGAQPAAIGNGGAPRSEYHRQTSESVNACFIGDIDCSLPSDRPDPVEFNIPVAFPETTRRFLPGFGFNCNVLYGNAQGTIRSCNGWPLYGDAYCQEHQQTTGFRAKNLAIVPSASGGQANSQVAIGADVFSAVVPQDWLGGNWHTSPDNRQIVSNYDPNARYPLTVINYSRQATASTPIYFGRIGTGAVPAGMCLVFWITEGIVKAPNPAGLQAASALTIPIAENSTTIQVAGGRRLWVGTDSSLVLPRAFTDAVDRGGYGVSSASFLEALGTRFDLGSNWLKTNFDGKAEATQRQICAAFTGSDWRFRCIQYALSNGRIEIPAAKPTPTPSPSTK